MTIDNDIGTRIFDAVGSAGGYRLARFLARKSVRMLVYHRFGEHACRAEVFDAQMHILKREFNVLSLSSLCQKLRVGDEIPAHSVVITIDDGYADFRQVAFPILQRYALPATIYVVSDFVDRRTWLWPDAIWYALNATRHGDCSVSLNGTPRQFSLDSPQRRRKAWNDVADHCLSLRNRAKLEFLTEFFRDLGVVVPSEPITEFASLTWNELREMSNAGVEIGSHTCTHPKLTMVDPDELEHELHGSKARIEEELQREVEGFCYPNGSRADVDSDVKQAVRRSGYRHATVGYHDFDITADLYELGRYGAASNLFDFKKTIYGIDYLRGI